MFEVRYIRADSDCQESYYYHSEHDALSHYNIRLDGDAELYLAVQLFEDAELLKQYIFGFSISELHLLQKIASCNQFDTCLNLYRLAEKQSGWNRDDLVSLRLRIASIDGDRFLTFINLVKMASL